MPLTPPPSAPPAAPDAPGAAPSRNDPASFRTLADAFVLWLVGLRTSLASLRTWLADFVTWAGTHNAELEALQTDVAGKQSTASTAAATATTKAGEAATSAANAAAARSAIDNRIYPGTYSVAPTTRPNGTAIQNGDMYVSDTSGIFTRVGGAWVIQTAASTVDLANNSDTAKGSALVGLSGLSPTTVYDILKSSSLRISALGQATAPTVAVNAVAGLLNGTYRYAVTFVTADGESECGAETAAVSPASQQVNLTNIPVSSSNKVTARRIYRTAAAAIDPVLKQLVATINDNVTTTYTDNVADGSLGASVPRIDTSGAVIYRNGARIASASQTTTVVGFNANPNNTGYANTAVGAQAMVANTTGFRNCAFGIFALTANTTGFRNTAVGVHSIGAASTALDNTGVGYGTLQNATASNNTAVGSLAMSETTTGDNNVALGYDTLQLNTTGSHNTAVGAVAMNANTTGQQNTALGRVALQSNQTGNFNVAVGMSAGFSVLGSSNVAVGFQALNTSTGSSNVAIGPQAGFWETGSNKLFIDGFKRASEADARSKALIYGVFDAGGSSGQSLALNAAVTVASTFGCNGKAAQPSVGVNAACTDLPTAIALINQLRAALIANGICV